MNFKWDRYGESQRFTCPGCLHPEGGKASKLLDFWHCFSCGQDGPLATLSVPRIERTYADRAHMRPVRVKVIEWPEGVKDVAELLTAEGGSIMFQALINLAKPHLLWVIEHLDDQYAIDTPDGAAEAADALLAPLLNQHPIARARYVSALAKRLDVPEESIRRFLNQAWRERRPNPQRRPR